MLEFVFCDPRARERFAEFLRARDVPVEELHDEQTYGVGIPEDTDDGLMVEIEDCYEEMMAFDRALFEADIEEGEDHSAGVVVNLASGDTVYARVDPRLLARIMEVLTPQELGELVNAIVDAVENPDTRPLCHQSNKTD